MAHWFPQAGGATRPSHGWYWGWALYVNRGGLCAAFIRLAPLGAALLVAAALIRGHCLTQVTSLAFALAGLVLLHSIVGHALVCSRSVGGYFDRLLAVGGVRAPAQVADLHIGTWHHTYDVTTPTPSLVLRPGGFTCSSGSCTGSFAPSSAGRVMTPRTCTRCSTSTPRRS